MVSINSHALKHGLEAEDAAYAWGHSVKCRQRMGTDDLPLWISIDVLPDGRMAELVGFLDVSGTGCVFHAVTPPTKKFMKELGFDRGQRDG